MREGGRDDDGGGTDTPEDAPPRIPGWRRGVRFVGAVVAHVFRDPVVHGRLRVVDWPPGLGVLTGCAGLGYLVAVGLAVLAPWIRGWVPLDASWDGEHTVPTGVTWVVMSLVFLAVTLLQTGTLHAAWWIRVLGLAVSAATLVSLGGTADHPETVTQAGLLAGCFGALVAFQLVRWRGRFRWWEFVVVVAVFGVAIGSARFGIVHTESLGGSADLEFATLTLGQLVFLAGPVALASGFAVAQIGFATVVWTVDLGRREFPKGVLVVALVGLLGWRAWAEFSALAKADVQLSQLVWSAGLLVGASGLWVLLDRIADRRSPGSTRVADLREDLRHVLVPVALAVGATGLLLPLLLRPLTYLGLVAEAGGWPAAAGLRTAADTFRATDPLLTVLIEWLVVVVLFGASVLLARRGDRGKAELIGLIALLHLAVNATSLRFATDWLSVLAVPLLIMLTLVLAARRRLTAVRVQGLLVATGSAALLSNRDFFADPMNVILSGTAALFLGLVWTMLTSGDDANADTRRLPRPNRVCLVLAGGLFGMAVLAYQNLSSRLAATRVLEFENAFGDGLFGGALLLGALVISVGNVLSDRDLGSSEELEAIAVHPTGPPAPTGQGAGGRSRNTDRR